MTEFLGPQNVEAAIGDNFSCKTNYQVDIYDGYYCMSTWLGYGIQILFKYYSRYFYEGICKMR